MRQLKHKNIVELLDFIESPEFYYIVLELIPGGELFHQIVRLTYFSEDLSRHVIIQVAEAIRYLHEEAGVVHRDIKPENLLFYPAPFIPSKVKQVRAGEDAENKQDEGIFIPGVGSGGIGVIKLADFGLSKIIWDSKTMTPCGTVGYTAPEIVNDQRYSKSVDMWALGCVLYTILCGFPPFYDESIKALTEKVARGEYTFLSPWWDEISKGAKDLVSHLLTVDPERRYTIDQFLNHPWITQSNAPTAPAHDSPLLKPSNRPRDAEKKKREIKKEQVTIEKLVAEEAQMNQVAAAAYAANAAAPTGSSYFAGYTGIYSTLMENNATSNGASSNIIGNTSINNGIKNNAPSSSTSFSTSNNNNNNTPSVSIPPTKTSVIFDAPNVMATAADINTATDDLNSNTVDTSSLSKSQIKGKTVVKTPMPKFEDPPTSSIIPPDGLAIDKAFMSPAVVAMKEAFDVFNAVHRREEESVTQQRVRGVRGSGGAKYVVAKKKAVAAAGGAVLGELDEEEEEEYDDDEEYENELQETLDSKEGSNNNNININNDDNDNDNDNNDMHKKNNSISTSDIKHNNIKTTNDFNNDSISNGKNNDDDDDDENKNDDDVEPIHEQMKGISVSDTKTTTKATTKTTSHNDTNSIPNTNGNTHSNSKIKSSSSTGLSNLARQTSQDRFFELSLEGSTLIERRKRASSSGSMATVASNHTGGGFGGFLTMTPTMAPLASQSMPEQQQTSSSSTSESVSVSVSTSSSTPSSASFSSPNTNKD